jgi:hypothetical protein
MSPVQWEAQLPGAVAELPTAVHADGLFRAMEKRVARAATTEQEVGGPVTRFER